MLSICVCMQKGMKERESILVTKALIGSRPPKCERRCRTCGHCEAVQVPIVPQVQSHRSHYSAARAATTVTYNSRGDDLSNYKPISWKCKCGDYFFNPWNILWPKGGRPIIFILGINNEIHIPVSQVRSQPCCFPPCIW